MERIYVLAHYDVIRLYVMTMCVWITEQIISLMVEVLIWGERFQHWFDLAFTLSLFAVFAIIANEMAKATVYKILSSVKETEL